MLLALGILYRQLPVWSYQPGVRALGDPGLSGGLWLPMLVVWEDEVLELRMVGPSSEGPTDTSFLWALSPRSQS